MHDMAMKGRTNPCRGETNVHAKITANAVRAIRSAYAAGHVTQQDLADRFGVSASQISVIINKHQWSHVE
jgi:DNA-binding transcriptional regulator YiaG